MSSDDEKRSQRRIRSYILISLVIFSILFGIIFLLVIRTYIISIRRKKEVIQRPLTFSCSSRQLFPNSNIYPMRDMTHMLHSIGINPSEYRTYNPSLCLIGNNIIVYYRLSNFTYDGEKVSPAEKMMHKGHGEYIMSYAILQIIPINNSNNILNELLSGINTSQDIHLLKMPPSLPEIETDPRVPKGFEDIRLTYSQDRNVLYGLMNSHTLDNYNRMFICPLGSINIDRFNINIGKPSMIVSVLTKEKCFEKNFPPFYYNNELYLSHSLFPHIVLKYQENNTIDKGQYNVTECQVAYKTGKSSIPLRGGSQSIHLPTKNLYIGCGHIREGLRYFHHVYAFEDSPPFSMKYISPRFMISNDLFGKDIVQVVTGMELIDDNLVLTYGEEDTRPYILVVPVSDVVTSFVSVDENIGQKLHII